MSCSEWNNGNYKKNNKKKHIMASDVLELKEKTIGPDLNQDSKLNTADDHGL